MFMQTTDWHYKWFPLKAMPTLLKSCFHLITSFRHWTFRTSGPKTREYGRWTPATQNYPREAQELICYYKTHWLCIIRCFCLVLEISLPFLLASIMGLVLRFASFLHKAQPNAEDMEARLPASGQPSRTTTHLLSITRWCLASIRDLSLQGQFSSNLN